jgi:ferredoxin
MERIDPIAIASAGAADSTNRLEDLLQHAPDGLPFEPPGAEMPGADDDRDATLRRLLGFFLLGQRPDAGDSPPDARAVPALLHQYREPARLRHDYPFALSDGDPAAAVHPLSRIIDDLIAGAGETGDAGERLQQHIYRIEPEIRALADQDRNAGLLELWDRAARTLLSRSRLSPGKKDLLRDNLARARKALPDRRMIACDADAPQRLLAELALRHWRNKAAGLRSELESLIQQLTDLLQIAALSSPAAAPDRPGETAPGAEAIDFKTMTSLLASSHLDHPFPERRRERIGAALDMLKRVQPLLSPETAPGAAPYDITRVFDHCDAARAELAAREQLHTEFFKALAIAKLELDNRYRESVHDDYFRRYEVNHLSPPERALLPPVLLRLHSVGLAPADVPALFDILNSRSPVKILLQIDALHAPAGAVPSGDVVIHWPARLAAQVLTLCRAYVLQAPVSRLQTLHRGFLDGLDYPGPALFSVYVGNADNRGNLSRFFDAGAAQESRVFPVFTYHPGNGGTLLDRLSVGDNSQPDRDWPAGEFRYRAADESDTSRTTRFTPADFLYLEPRCADQFWPVPPHCRHENLLPLPDYLDLDAGRAGNRIPYIETVDADGRLRRVIMRRQIVDAVRDCAAYWHQLQELGGINNSYTRQQVAEAANRLEADKQREVEAVKAQYRAQMEQDIGRLTGEIVRRIAQQLLQFGAAPAGTLYQPAPIITPHPTEPAAVAPPAAAVTAPAVEAEDEEPAVSLDDPYIDTPLCTSCNDCIKVNDQLFAYDANKQAYIKDAKAGTYKDLVAAAEKCPVKIIHPGKPRNASEPGLDELQKRAAKFM